MIKAKKVVLTVMKAFGILVGFLVVSLCFVWFFPGILLNSATLDLTKYFLNKGANSVRWREGTLSASSKKFNLKNVVLELQDACVQIPSIGIDACFPKLAVSADFSLKKGKPTLIAIDKIQVQSSHFFYVNTQTSKPGKKKPSNSNETFSIPAILAEGKIHGVNISIDEWKVESAGVLGKGELRLSTNEETATSFYTLLSRGELQMILDGKKDLVKFSGDVELRRRIGLDWTGKGSVSLNDRFHRTAKLNLEVTPQAPMTAFSLVGSFSEPHRSLSLNATGAADEKKVQAKLDLNGRNLINEIERLGISQCAVNADLTKSVQHLNLDCPFSASLAFTRPEDLPHSPLARKITGQLQTTLDKRTSSSGSAVSASLDLRLDPLFAEVKDGTGHLVLKGGGNLEDPIERWRYSVDSTFTAKKMKRVTRFLAKTAWAVPEPFAQLDGTVQVQIKGDGSGGKSDFLFPINVRTSLKSSRQSLDLTADGNLFLTSDAKKANGLNMEVSLEDVQLILPPLDPYALPRPLPDSRIERSGASAPTDKVKSKSPPFDLRLAFKTADNAPIRLVSGLSEGAIPIVFDLKMTPEDPLVGSIDVKPFPLTLFKRNAKVQEMHVGLRRNPEFNVVHGKIQVDYVDYTIFILVDGLLSHPSIHFISNPPMPDKQVIAVLLFGRPIDALTSDETQSVGATRSALADGAIGIASMYALASTPIESVGYDSIAKEFSAKIRLADNTSMTIGTNLKDVNRLGIRRRLGPNLDINTYLENPFFATERSLTTFLEWNWRY